MLDRERFVPFRIVSSLGVGTNPPVLLNPVAERRRAGPGPRRFLGHRPSGARPDETHEPPRVRGSLPSDLLVRLEEIERTRDDG